MGVLTGLASAAVGVNTDMGPNQRRKRAEVRPIMERVARASAAHERGPMDPNLLDAIAWTESHHSWRRGQRPSPVGVKLGDVPGRGFEGYERALGLMQVWSGHEGKTFGQGWWPSPGGAGITWNLSNWEDPEISLVAATDILFDAGYGENSREMLRIYSGAARGNIEAINDYSRKVYGRYTYLSSLQLIGGAP